ncbi:hypothetical protein RchiOBHm_Chr7g0188131 [Rosa chinensis]|uniref:DUF4042 domain-containing protein n=1 Tax=Rosa chinensis TaxID=74649 RepID=A0A2P6P4F0_ROSCH|nr:HEAT repeat-containing protein 6 [Rosa chinensis]PRQ16798.1 hypothetical protein RchiOBHm_Chr7g0188131 [Rosa chinensis]
MGGTEKTSKVVMTASVSQSPVRWWRTAFLTVRDETLTTPPRTPIPELLHNFIFSHSHTLLSAAPDLPPQEVTSDLLFLTELITTKSHGAGDLTPTFAHTIHLIHDVSHRLPLEVNSASWTLMLDGFGNMLQFFIASSSFTPSMECLQTLRRVMSTYQRKCSPADEIQLVKFLLRVIESCHSELSSSLHSIRNQSSASEVGKRKPSPQHCSLWEAQTLAFNMLGETISRAGSLFPVDIWKSSIEVFRKVMDVLAAKSLLVEDTVMSRFYLSLLHCLHLTLSDRKCSLSDHVSGFVAALRMFLSYGISSRSQLTRPATGQKESELSVASLKSGLEDPKKTDRSPYRPPHLRKRDSSKQIGARGSQGLSDQESSTLDFASSDSDYSDSDGSLKDTESIQKSKVRVAAIVCIQDLCQADSKSFSSQWTLLLPTSDVLQPRKFEATLMTCLLFDPYLKARVASASTLEAMLDGPSSVFLQVAEFKESSKRGSFTALSSSLGHILMQLHTGILYLIQRETHSRLLASLFKILMLLISSTPYSRMPGELLPTVFTSLQERIQNGFQFKSDQTGLLVSSFSCLTTALNTSPSSPQIKEMLQREIFNGFAEAKKKSGVLFTLFQFSEQVSNPPICFEALQALRAVSHNYPSIMFSCWEQISTIVYHLLRAATPEVPAGQWKGHTGNSVGFIGEKLITAAIRVLDESLRAISGFKGTEDPLDDKLLDAPFTSDCIRMKKVSSAPSYELESLENTRDEPTSCQSGIEQWCEAIEKHMPLILQHTSAMVRAASVTCFAGITSSVFCTLSKEKRDFILSSLVRAAVHGDVPSVRAAACRAIGVISSFPQVSQSAEILDKFVHAVESNTRDPLVSVRITASWALANICDSIHHCIDDFSLEKTEGSLKISQLFTLLTECALRLTKDGDKIKSNAVRALGNLSRSIKCTIEFEAPGDYGKGCQRDVSISYHPASLRDSRWLDRVIQAFISCVTTGNVKVQWNVCHALSNLFLNETLRLQDMDWAPSVFSILLLLLRDSSNFKIRIQAAAALAVPASVHDYGESFSDVIQGLEHILENQGSDQIASPSNFKYRVALEKQLTSTMLHVLILASSSDHEPVKVFLVKKASFFEDWFKALCSSLGESSSQPELENKKSLENPKKEMICNAIRSLIQLYNDRKHHAIAEKFEKLEKSIQ